MSNPTGDFIWYELMTPDPDGATAFYGPVVGWTIGGADPTAGDLDYRMITRSAGGPAGGVLGLTDAMCEGGAHPCWLGYIHVADVDAAASAITAKGGKVLMPATDIAVGRIAMVADPQGAPFYLMTPIPPPGMEDARSDVFSMDQPQHIRWNELSTTDPEAAITFYTSQFGWAQEGQMDIGDMGAYRFIQHHGVGLGAVMPKMPEMPTSLWSYYIGVDDINRAAETVAELGGRVLFGPMEIPGGEFALNGIDPQGAAFGLVGPGRT